jgi:hypothetical protein
VSPPPGAGLAGGGVAGEAGVVAVALVVLGVVEVVDVSPDSSLLPQATASGVNRTAAPIATTVDQRRYSVGIWTPNR